MHPPSDAHLRPRLSLLRASLRELGRRLARLSAVAVIGLAMATSAASGCALLLATSGCGGDVPRGGGALITPLEQTNLAPSPTGAEPYPEAIATVKGDREEHAWAHGRAFIRAPLPRVWAALQDPDVCVDRREVTTWTVARDVDAAVPVSFRVHNVVKSFLTVEFDSLWRQSAVEGTREAPSLVVARAEVTGGTPFITVLADSVVLRSVDANTTAVELIRHRKSLSGGAKDAEQYLRDLYASLRAKTRGEALPRY